ncbi:MAG: hypothetical protein DRP02_07175 [Candidatus Gerdarchaeota archaeon]|nr:MAG: hypothetical protein DRP02_07175 [Candidatus Gerdarchaeota archaeon]
MNIQKKVSVLGGLLTFAILVSALVPTVSAKTNKIHVSHGSEGILVQTEYLTLKILDNSPNFIWWLGNQSSADEIYQVNFHLIQEFFGSDSILDNITELGGIAYIFKGNQWSVDIVESDAAVQVTLTLAGLSNGAMIQFIITVFEEDQTLPNTEIKGLSEVKIDIIVDNWHFSKDAKGYAIQTIISEMQHKHQMRIRNGTQTENGNHHRTMQFENIEHGTKKVAYYKWATFANVYSNDTLIDTIDVGTFYSIDIPRIPGPASGSPNVFLTYPNYGNGYKLVHDPSVGVYPNSLSIPLSTIAILGGLVMIVAIAVIIKKRK